MRDLSKVKIHSQGVCVSSETQSDILKDISLFIPKNKVIAFIGPSGCGKTVFLQCLNRMIDLRIFKLTGDIFLDDQNINDLGIADLRTRVGMITQQPNPFPFSVYDNVAYGLKLHHLCRGRAELDEAVERVLKQAGLWREVKEYLHKRGGFELSLGQQQRLCIARSLAVNPEVLLMDEPCSALDPKSTHRIEKLIRNLSRWMTIVIVTDRMDQAARSSDRTVVFAHGEVVEENETAILFKNPRHPLTRAYLLH